MSIAWLTKIYSRTHECDSFCHMQEFNPRESSGVHCEAGEPLKTSALPNFRSAQGLMLTVDAKLIERSTQYVLCGID